MKANQSEKPLKGIRYKRRLKLSKFRFRKALKEVKEDSNEYRDN